MAPRPAEVSRVQRCPRCDAVTDATARFCTQCGQALTDSAPPPRSRDLGRPAGDPAEAESPPAAEPRDQAEPERPDGEAPDAVEGGPTDLPLPTGDATRVIDVDLQACPRCGASNAVRRARCGRCGGQLDAPAVHDARDTPPGGTPVATTPPPRPAPPENRPRGAGPTSGASRSRRRRGVAAAIVLVGLLVGAGLGLAAGRGVGPFASPTEVEFDPEAYPSEPSPVQPVTTGASSTRTSADLSFGPRAAVDDDPATAWVPRREDADPRLVHHFDAPVWIDRIEVATGLGGEEDEAVDGVGRMTGALIDLRRWQVDAALEDTGGFQVIQLPDPVLVEEVTWRVTSTSEGSGSVAEVRYRGWPADEEDRDTLHGR